MANWSCDDRAWMKNRRNEWRSVQNKLDYLYFLKKEWKPAVKHYFMTGMDLTEGHYQMKNLDIAPLIELWFDPDDSTDSWARIRQKYDDNGSGNWQWAASKSRCYELLHKLGKSTLLESDESFFNGRDERLFDLFFKRGLKRDFFPEMSDEDFAEHAWNSYRFSASLFQALYADSCNSHSALFFRLEEWRDSFVLAYDPERPELEWVIQLVDQTLACPDNFSLGRGKLAVEINKVLEDPILPKAAKAKIQELRARPCHPNCIDFDADESDDDD